MAVKHLQRLVRDREYKKQHVFYKNAYVENCIPWANGGRAAPFLWKALRKIKQRLTLKRALDFGSGEGRNSVAIERCGLKVIGVEYQQKALKIAQGKGLKNILYVRGDIYRIPLKPDSFDVLVDYGVFHHIRRKDTKDYLDLIDSLLVSGGFYLLSCFASNFKHGNGKVYKRGFVSHKNHYDRFTSKTELKKVFGKSFEILEIETDKDRFLHLLARLK
ncbi:MAG: class I SAM-dependent methyltransferase [Candidatus Desulfatibia sp.]|uniref:class I SAM-dependent methyltransferase n=1 Tax=Candidatus Desulfatibia sp. TaxID=3101189 RepID=UPI002F3311A3